MINAVLFDYDGTLVKSMDYHFAAWKETFKRYGKNLRPEEFYPHEGEKLNLLVKRVMNKDSVYELSDSDIKRIIKEKDDYYRQNSRFELYPGVEAFLKRLKNSGIKTAIVTAGRRERIKATATVSFLEHFDTMVAYGDTEKAKPNPDPFLLAVNRLKVAIKESIVIENAPLGIKAAKNAGITCIAISSTVDSKYLSDADYLAKDFIEINNLKLFNNHEKLAITKE